MHKREHTDEIEGNHVVTDAMYHAVLGWKLNSPCYHLSAAATIWKPVTELILSMFYVLRHDATCGVIEQSSTECRTSNPIEVFLFLLQLIFSKIIWFTSSTESRLVSQVCRLPRFQGLQHVLSRIPGEI